MDQAQEQSAAIMFKHSVQVEVERPGFIVLDAVSHLDLRSLGREDHVEIELGYFDTECRPFVRAVVEKGTVVNLLIEPCSGDKAPADPQIAELFRAAHRKVAGRGKKWRPVSLSTFMRRLGNQGGVTIDVITCFRICFFGICFVCCTTINEDLVYCGDRVIIHRD